MERGSYSRLDQIDHIQIELTEQPPASLADETSELHKSSNTHEKHIDYVLVYESQKDVSELDDESLEERRKLAAWRYSFERCLVNKLGLILQHKTVIIGEDPEIERHFILIHAPWDVLAQNAERMRLKVPLRVNDAVFTSWLENIIGSKLFEKLQSKNPFVVHDSTLGTKPNFYMAPFVEDHMSEFVNNEDKETFFSVSDRHYIVQQLLQNARFARGPDGVGLQRLLLDRAYIAGYSLHDGPDSRDEGEAVMNDRQKLKADWARFGRSFKYQPYDAIKDYFGHEVGLYFAWLGFYTAMLVPLAIVGLLVFISGIASAGSYIPVQDLCDEKNRGRWYMCPLCDKQCSYWNLAPDTCMYAYITHLLDNDGTLFLAFVVAIWATLFLEFWKRRQASLAQEWHTTDFEEEEEQLRPEYKKSLPDEQMQMFLFKRNPDTGKIEPVVSKIKTYRRYGTVFAVVSFMILLVLGAAIGVVVYRAAVFAVLSSNDDNKVQKRARVITAASAACINLIFIMLLSKLYEKLAIWLTDWENPPTESAYKDSFTWKMSSFQFVNNYSAIFYIAFFKSDLIVGSPGRYRRLMGKYRLDGCSEQGCFLELAVQLFIIMVGKQIFFNIFEMAMPYLNLIKNRRNKENPDGCPQFENDYDLTACEKHYLFWEYLEIVLQYGFVTMFVAAFPLSPLFALINTIIEIRLDAIKFLCHFRRPDVSRVEDIGAWYDVLEAVTRASVLVNAFILAFTSEFIPKLLYKVMYAPDRYSSGGGTLKGYVNFTLAAIDLRTLYAWENGTQPDNPTENLNYTRDYCRYPGYHDNTYPYGYSKTYWHLLTARLAFVFVFQFIVYAVTGFVAWLVPDAPDELQFKIEREIQMVKSVFHTQDYDSDVEEIYEEEDDNVTQYEDAQEEIATEK